MLQPLWSISRLRPNSVSFGSTATQNDFSPQSPQPSQTSELIMTRFFGSGILPRLRRRRFSVAQVWSKISTDTPSISRRRFWVASSRSRSRNSTPPGKMSGLFHFAMSSLITMIVLTPSLRTWWAMSGTVSVPSTGCPPVIATASL